MNKERKNQNLKKNLIFAAAVLLLAAVISGYYLIRRANRPDKVAHLVYGTFDRAQTDILWTAPAPTTSASSSAS